MSCDRVKFHKYFTTANQTATVTGPARLEKIVVGTGASSAVVTVYNNTTTSDPVTIVNAAAAISHDYGGVQLSNMHIVISGGNANVTVVYS